METVKFLKQFSSTEEALNQLTQQFGIIVKDYDNAVVLNYNQIESPKTHPITIECRGLMLSKDNWVVMRRGFDRFFNYGELEEHKNFNFGKSICFEKVDGSIIFIYYDFHQLKWCAGTRGTAYAESNCNSGRPFIELIETALNNKVDDIFRGHFPCKTFIFELTCPENRVVKRYSGYELVLLGIRSDEVTQFEDGTYYSIDKMNSYVKKFRKFGCNIRMPLIYRVDSFHKIQEEFENMGVFDEGFVFFDEETLQRIKVKKPEYVAIHHLRDNGVVSPKRILDLVWSGEHEEYLNYFEEDRDLFQPWINAVSVFYDEMLKAFETIVLPNANLSQKDFALMIKDLPYKSILFELRKGTRMHDIMTKMKESFRFELIKQFIK